MNPIFGDISIVLVLATTIAIIFKFLKQPPTLAYILAGVILGPLALIKLFEPQSLESFADIGITLLLFMLGLELKISELLEVGKTALITGIGQIVFTAVIGFLISIGLGFDTITSIYLSIGLTFSSTIIIVKLLSDKKDLNSLYGRISIGFLLVQDFVAILALIILAGMNQQVNTTPMYISIPTVILKATVLFAIIVYLSQTIIPKIIRFLSDSREILFLFSLAWAFGLCIFISSDLIGLSIEIGGFLAGLSLANTKESFQIVTKVRSLRDFFITIFFVILGMHLTIDDIGSVILPALLLSAFVLIGNPIIVMIIMGFLGFKKKTSFSAGLTVAQISEFSLIVLYLGKKIGHVSDEVISIITIVGIITFTLSTYAILNDKILFNLLKPYLSIFERKKSSNKIKKQYLWKNHIIVAGANRIGLSTLEQLKSIKDEVLVVDFDPEVIEQVSTMGFHTIMGDFADKDIQERAEISRARIVFSTLPNIEDNLIIATTLDSLHRKPKFIVALHKHSKEIDLLYEAGIDYIILPHHLTGEIIGKHLKKGNFEKIEKLNEKAYWLSR
jgi:Kef-type K+ transport system membrane component KefB